ncbi:HAMP domain-containing histidine kinase [bacterium]|nr:HAMP domain-containing histidine kinase [bacterium]
MDEDSPLDSAYRNESEHLVADRLPLTVGLCLGLFGLAGIFEYLLYDDHWPVFLAIYPLEVAVFVPLLMWRRELVRRGWLSAVNILAWSALMILVHVYGWIAGMPPELTLLAAICLMTGVSLLLPWGLRGQSVLVAVALIASAALLAATPASAVPAPYLLFVSAAAAAVSLFGAHHLDLYRFAIFCEATRREEEAAVGQSLVAIAREINDSLDADDVLDRIADAIRSALHASWSVIILRDAQGGHLIVGTAGRVPGAIASLRGVEFDAGAFPLVDRILDARDLSLSDEDADSETAALLQRWETRSLLGAALSRRDAVIGVVLAGTRAGAARFADRGRELVRGVAQHVAIALNNVRLVSDLRRADSLKTEFLSTMSHELRTPLNVIIGYADLLRDEAFGPVIGDQQDVLRRLRDNAHSLLELINATLEVNRIEAGRSGLQLREVDLRTLLTELQYETDALPRQPGVALRWEVPRNADLIRTDPMKLKIVVRNLVGNALKFTKRGAVTVSVLFDARARLLDVQVRDTGVGIPSEHLPHIFDMFHQAPSDAATSGVGLGLYIVRRFVELLGGRVSASSRPGDGSIFRLSLPAGVVMQPQPVSIEEHRRRRSA